MKPLPGKVAQAFSQQPLSNNDGFLHFHPEFEIMLNISSNGTRLIGDSVEIFDKHYLTMIAGNIPHRWNHYSRSNESEGSHSLMCHFKPESMGDAFLSQPELSGIKDLLEESRRGIVFSRKAAITAEKPLRDMTSSKGIEKVIAFLSLMKVLAGDEQRRPIVSEDYSVSIDSEGTSKISEAYSYIQEQLSK